MTSAKPLVSVVIPNYNRSHVLRLCLRSVAAQTYAPIEVIVVNDGGTDDSPLVALSMGATLLSTEVNTGPSAARNLGAARARGEILFFLDSDIALAVDSIENAVAILTAAPTLGAVCGILLPEPLVSQTLAARYRALQTYHWWMPTDHPTRAVHAALLAVRAEVFREVGPFDPRQRETEAADYRARLLRRHPVKITAAVRGRHDHDAALRTTLRKVFRRARVSASQRRSGEVPGDSWPRVFAGLLVCAAALAVPAPLLFGPAGAVVSPALAAAAVTLDGTTYRRGFTEHGIRFGLYFVVVHLLVTLVGAVGAASGTLQRLLAGGRPHPMTAQVDG